MNENYWNFYCYTLFKGVFRKKATQKKKFPTCTPVQGTKNDILQLLSQLHQNSIGHLEILSKKVDFRPFLTTNPPLIPLILSPKMIKNCSEKFPKLY